MLAVCFQIMLLKVFIIVALIWAFSCNAYKILYVLPNNSTDSNCPCQPCATLGQLLLNNDGSLPITVNVEYHFLPGKHQVTNRIVLQYLHNFSLVGIANSNTLKAVIICRIQIYNSINVTLKNVIFKSSSEPFIIKLQTCLFCKICNVTFYQYGVLLTNLIEMSYLENVTVNLSITPPVLDMCYHGILLRYWDLPWTDNEEHILKINKLTINGNNNMCHNPNSLHGAAISILLKQTKYS